MSIGDAVLNKIIVVLDEQIAALNAIADKAEAEMEREERTITLEDFLTKEQIRRCLAAGGLVLRGGQLYRTGKKLDGDYTAWVRETIIEPNMAEINAKLGQENDARYLAYLVTYVVGGLYKRSA